MTRPALILAALIALTSPAAAVQPIASPLAGLTMHGDELQFIRTCRPGERPANPRQCRQPGGSRPLI